MKPIATVNCATKQYSWKVGQCYTLLNNRYGEPVAAIVRDKKGYVAAVKEFGKSPYSGGFDSYMDAAKFVKSKI